MFYNVSFGLVDRPDITIMVDWALQTNNQSIGLVELMYPVYIACQVELS